ncbi:MAG: hypothetical protein OXI24_16085 [Candidatus Poribacteria bacterium]|nr:hypothetical protein [Candidatus Poribacteria bacterium]
MFFGFRLIVGVQVIVLSGVNGWYPNLRTLTRVDFPPSPEEVGFQHVNFVTMRHKNLATAMGL